MRTILRNNSLVRQTRLRVRGYLQEREAAAANRHYQRQAAEQNLAPLSAPDLRAALAARLKDRRAAQQPKAIGDLHVFVAFALTNWEAVLPRSLEPFGKITVYEWRSRGFRDDTDENWVTRRDAMNADMLAAFEAAHAERPVDVVVGYVSGTNTSPETLAAMQRRGAVVLNFCFDDKLRFPGVLLGGRYVSPAALASTVDLNLTSAPDSVIKYVVHGGLAMFWPEAALPEVHRPYDVPFEYDVSFIGNAYGLRPGAIAALRSQGINVTTFGRGWPNGPLDADEMIRMYSRSRINLGFGGIGSSDKLTCLKGRDFEVPMSGGLYLMQYNPELSLCYDIGSEIVCFTDPADCAAKIRQLLADPVRAQAIRTAGRERCLRDHTYLVRWTHAFKMAGVLEQRA